MAGAIAGPWETILNRGGAAFQVDNEEFWLPVHSAGKWIDALARGALEDVIPDLLAPEDRVRWTRLYWEDNPTGGPLISQALHSQIVNLCVSEASGMPWTAAHALIGFAGNNWRYFDGWCVRRQVEPLELPLDRFVNLVYVLRYESLDDKERAKLDLDLFKPPPDASPADRNAPPPGWDEASVSAGWAAAMAGTAAITGRPTTAE